MKKTLKEKCQGSIIDVRWERDEGSKKGEGNEIKLIIMNEGSLVPLMLLMSFRHCMTISSPSVCAFVCLFKFANI